MQQILTQLRLIIFHDGEVKHVTLHDPSTMLPKSRLLTRMLFTNAHAHWDLFFFFLAGRVFPRLLFLKQLLDIWQGILRTKQTRCAEKIHLEAMSGSSGFVSRKCCRMGLEKLKISSTERVAKNRATVTSRSTFAGNGLACCWQIVWTYCCVFKASGFGNKISRLAGTVTFGPCFLRTKLQHIPPAGG